MRGSNDTRLRRDMIDGSCSGLHDTEHRCRTGRRSSLTRDTTAHQERSFGRRRTRSAWRRPSWNGRRPPRADGIRGTRGATAEAAMAVLHRWLRREEAAAAVA
ncbi:hypothetical protein MTO96_000791 [Rhipicephalus appendiculatus]